MEKIQNDIPYEKCLNCGAELVGKFCHKCGQQATSKTQKFKEFLLEYLNNAFIWDPQFFKTIFNLVCRPGRLTNEYMSGKFISQEHPLKLNMFLLFVFVSMFLFFSRPNGSGDPISLIKQHSEIYPVLQVEFLKGNQSFAERVNAAPRDTVQLYAPLTLATKYPDVVSQVAVLEEADAQGLSKIVAVVPRTLIEDDIIVQNEEGCYVFSTEEKSDTAEANLFKRIWGSLVDIVTTYFPMLMLFTAPLLALAVARIQRKKKLPFIQHFIFSLHYTAFIELLTMVIYVLYLTVSPSFTLLRWMVRLVAGSYLILSFRKVYEPNSWFKAIVKALFSYLIYALNLLFLILLILIIAIFVVAAAEA